MITLSNKNNKENKQASNDQSKLDNLYEIAKEFLPANDQTNRMSNAFAPMKSQQKSLEEIAKEFLPTKDKTFKHDNGANFDK